LATEVTTRVVGARIDRRKRRPINPDDIVDGAIELVEGHTVDDLNMTVLSERLGSSVTTIYWHFHRREDLLIAMTDRVMRTCEFPAPYIDTHDWRESLRNHARATRSIFVARPILVDLILIREALSSAMRRKATEMTEQAITGLIEAGLSTRDACQTVSALVVHVRGSAVLERLTHRAQRSEHANPVSGEISVMSADASPLAKELARTGRRIGVPAPNDFEYGLRCILDGHRRQTDHHMVTRDAES